MCVQNLSEMMLCPAQVALHVLKSLSQRLNQPICDQVFLIHVHKRKPFGILYGCPRVTSSVQNLD